MGKLKPVNDLCHPAETVTDSHSSTISSCRWETSEVTWNSADGRCKYLTKDGLKIISKTLQSAPQATELLAWGGRVSKQRVQILQSSNWKALQMTFHFASSDVLKYLLLNLTWSLEASNRASKLSRRFVFGAEMPNAWHTPEVGFLATVWQQLLQMYFKVETKQKCSACHKKRKTTRTDSILFPSAQERLKEQKHRTADLPEKSPSLAHL